MIKLSENAQIIKYQIMFENNNYKLYPNSEIKKCKVFFTYLKYDQKL